MLIAQKRGARLPADRHVTYQQQYRKCSKPNCKTCREGKGHGPYWYGYTRYDGKLHSHYIGKNLPEQQEGQA